MLAAAPAAAAPAASTPAAPAEQLVPKWAGQFDTHQDWVNRAQRALSVPEHKPKAICVDAKGRRCHIGADMARARDEGAFPVRYFWECKPAASTTGAAQTAEQVRDQTLEEAAVACDSYEQAAMPQYRNDANGALCCARNIRALKRPTPTHSSEGGDA